MFKQLIAECYREGGGGGLVGKNCSSRSFVKLLFRNTGRRVRFYSANNDGNNESMAQPLVSSSPGVSQSSDDTKPVGQSLSSRSSMVLSKPNAILNRNVFPTTPLSKELKYKNLSQEDKEKQIFQDRKREEQQFLWRSKKKIDKKSTSAGIPEEQGNFEDLLQSNQFHRIKPYIGKSKDEELIKDYLQFLEENPSIRILNTKLDGLAKKDKHSLSEPIFKQLIYFLTHIDLAQLTSMKIHILRPNTYTFNIMMMSYLTVGDIPAVQSLFDSINIWVGKIPGYVNFVTLLTAYCRVGDLKSLNELFKRFIDGSIRLREGLDNQEAVTSVFTVLMKSLMDRGKIVKVEEIYQKFLALEFAPSEHMRNIMLNVYKFTRNYQKCVEMFEDYQKAYKPDRHIIQTMMSVYGYMGKAEEMEKLFSSIEKPNDFTYIVMTGAYCSSGLEVQAEECFSRIVNRDDKILCRMMDMYSRKGNIEKLEQTFSLIRKPTVASIYIYVDGISKFGNYEKVNELIKSIPPEQYTGHIWVCHLQSAVKTKFTDPDQYLERVHSIFFKKPSTISSKDNAFGMKLYKLALGLQLSSKKSKPTKAIEKPITEIYRDFAEKKVKLAMDGVDEGKFQTRDSFHEQFALDNDSIYRPDYVSPYEAFLEGYYKKQKTDLTRLEKDIE